MMVGGLAGEVTPEELAKLAPNMRKPMACSRERLPLWVEMRLNDEPLFGESATPAQSRIATQPPARRSNAG